MRSRHPVVEELSSCEWKWLFPPRTSRLRFQRQQASTVKHPACFLITVVVTALRADNRGMCVPIPNSQPTRPSYQSITRRDSQPVPENPDDYRIVEEGSEEPRSGESVSIHTAADGNVHVESATQCQMRSRPVLSPRPCRNENNKPPPPKIGTPIQSSTCLRTYLSTHPMLHCILSAGTHLEMEAVVLAATEQSKLHTVLSSRWVPIRRERKEAMNQVALMQARNSRAPSSAHIRQ